MQGFSSLAGFCFLSLNAHLFHSDSLCVRLLLGPVNTVLLCGRDTEEH